MGLSLVTYALCKKFTQKYVEETAQEFGGLKGANCTIKSITKEDGRSVVVFEWVNSQGETRTSTMYVTDGTPIYTWIAGDHYKFGDLVINESAFYRCIVPNNDTIFDTLKWEEIGSPDGNYDIVQTASHLPTHFTVTDRKMYYCIDEDLFYLWNGEEWVPRSSVQKASSSTLGGVKVDEESINLKDDGTISVNVISDNDINKLFS